MCVISACVSERITPEQVAKQFAENPHGAGIAWREWTDKKGGLLEMPLDLVEARKVASKAANKVVVWKKGLSLEAVQELVAKVPLPFVVHFRIPSCGGPSEYLTHPFPITAGIELELEGSTPSQVLFHNGHWNEWKRRVEDTAAKGQGKIPTGKWSDSRALAWMAYNMGAGVLELINEKVCVFGPGPDDIELFGEYQWTKISNGKEGIYVSNTQWQNRTISSSSGRVSGNVASKQATGHSDSKRESGTSADADTEGERGVGVRNLTMSRSTPPGGSTSEVFGGGKPTESSTKAASKQVSMGGDTAKGPFDFYHAAVRLWQTGKIGKKSFKRSRHRYELLCRKLTLQPEDRPLRYPIEILSKHIPKGRLVDPRLTTIGTVH